MESCSSHRRRAKVLLRKESLGLICLAAVLLLPYTHLSAAEQSFSSTVMRYKVVSLQYARAEQAKRYLAELELGTVSHIKGTNSLLVTAQQGELAKAVAILKIADTAEEIGIKPILPVADVRTLPSNDDIAGEAGNISIGSFTNPPETSAHTRAIIDIHAGAVVVIAPVSRLQDILSAVERIQKPEAPKVLQTAELGQANPETVPAKKPSPTVAPKLDTKGRAIPEEILKLLQERAARAGMPAPKLPEASAAKSPDPKAETKRPADAAGSQQSPQPKAEAAPPKLDTEGRAVPEEILKLLQERAARSGMPAPELPEALASERPGRRAEVATPAPEQSSAAEPNVVPAVTTPPASPQPEPEKTAVKPAPKIEARDEPEKRPKPAETEEPRKVFEPAAAGGQYEPEPLANGNDVLKLDLPEKLTLVDLLSFVGEHLQLDYIYDPKKVVGEVTLKLQGKLRGPIKVSDLYPLLESVLKFKGFVMTRKDNIVTVVPATEVLDVDPALQTEVGEIEHGDVVITRVFQLQHIDPSSASSLLTNMKLGAVSPTAAADSLIVTDYAYRMPRIETLLEMIDKPGEPKRFKFRQLKYTMATILSPKVKTLAEQLGTVSVSISTAPELSTAKRAGESDAAYRARLSREAAARTARARTQQTALAAQQDKPTVFLDADERTNRILMIGIAEQIDLVEELIDALDVEQQDLRALKLYKIEHVDAEEVRKKLQELGIIGTTQTTSSRITGAPRTATTQTAARTQTTPRPTTPTRYPTTSTTQESLLEEPQVVTIESTNSLLVNATAEQHAQIVTILEYVDTEMLEAEMPYKIYPLENQKPEDLAGVLQQLVEETIKDKEGKVEKVVKKIEDEIVIVPDENTFSIIVYASMKNQKWIETLIEQLDKRRPQVLIDVALVEITRTELFEYDLNIIANANTSPTNNIGIKGSILPNMEAVGGEFEGGWNLGGGAQVQGFYAEGNIQALLTAMNQKDYGRVLAQPKVLVNDNEEGVINTSEKTYVQESTTVYTDQGVPVTSSKWTEYPAKIELQITPNISEGELLRLEINMTREDFEKKEGRPPDYRTSTVTTVVTVPDGSTIILGGLTKLNQSKGGSKVPVLGDLPLLGGLFRSVANSDKANKLYIFVKANILRPDETTGMAQLKRISDESRAAFESAESKFQERADWPGFEAKPMEPRKVLGDI